MTGAGRLVGQALMGEGELGSAGRELANEVHRRWPRVKVLYTTGYARNSIIHHGRLDTGVELITKPFTQSSLAAKVRGVLDQKTANPESESNDSALRPPE